MAKYALTSREQQEKHSREEYFQKNANDTKISSNPVKEGH